MALTSIGSQKTPGRPVEITFAGERGLPSDAQELLLIGHAASGATGTNTIITIANVSDQAAAKTEAETKFGVGSELAKMVVAAVKANSGGSTFPAIKVCPLAHDDTSIAEAAQTAIVKKKAEFLVSCYDMQEDTTERDILKDMALTMSGAQRVHNNQFGTFGVAVNMSESDPSALDAVDTQYLWPIYFRDTGSNPYGVGEVAAACAAVAAANGVPFNPLDDVTVGGITKPTDDANNITVGAGLESEVVLGLGWTPMWVKPNGEVAFVRTVTGRISADGTGSPVVTAYYDLQDFQVLYYWRKTLYTRFAQPDFKQRKFSVETGREIKSEAIRLATTFEEQGMFQAVSQLAKRFQVEASASDRHRADVKTPVNVIPGLHVIATNIEATTEFDVVTI